MFRVAILTLALVSIAASTPAQAAEKTACVGCHASCRRAGGSCVSCHRGDPSAQRQELAHYRLIRGRAAEHRLDGGPAVLEGRALVEKLACRRCHQIGTTGNLLATSLDSIVWQREQADLASSIAVPVENMPRFGLDTRQVEALIAALLNAGDRTERRAAYRVRFDRGTSAHNVGFEKECGGCHRALLRNGPAGRGLSGPNLSGLFTAYYPASSASNRRWTPEALRKWIANPRAVRPRTTMRPLTVDESSWSGLLHELGGVY